MKLFVLIVSLLLTGCTDLNYYRQAAMGQWHLLSQRRDIQELVTAEQAPDQLKIQLKLVQKIRDFASEELLLPDNRSYRTYADLDRPYAVWNVVAAPTLSVDPLTWCFPVAGCVPYRGYFNREAAQRFAYRLDDQGYDVQVYGVPAYSTLNWFDDPVLNTFIHYPEPHLAALIFHELAHQKLYIKDDGTFNESFAQAVEVIGVERWLRFRRMEESLKAFMLYRNRQQEFVDLVLQTRQELEHLYDSDLSEPEQLVAKEDLFELFRERYAVLKQEWGNDDRFDGWLERPLNNAHFALIATYHTYVPAFIALLEQHQGDLRRFYQAAAELAELPPAERQSTLQELLDGKVTAGAP